jgi:hypothetical protein
MPEPLETDDDWHRHSALVFLTGLINGEWEGSVWCSGARWWIMKVVEALRDNLDS